MFIKNTEENLHRASATILCNKMCQLNHLTPNYIKLTISGHKQQCCKAKTTYAYKNTEENLHRADAAISFNKICQLNNLTPNYINL
jgi:hypothetical protein